MAGSSCGGVWLDLMAGQEARLKYSLNKAAISGLTSFIGPQIRMFF